MAVRQLPHLFVHIQIKKHVVDLEMLDESQPNCKQRAKRRSFYIRNGYKETGLYLSYLGVDYEVLSMDEHFDSAIFKEMMETLQIENIL